MRGMNSTPQSPQMAAAAASIMTSSRPHPVAVEIILPVLKSPKNRDPKEKRKCVTLATESHTNIGIATSESYSVFNEHRLVDSPRRIILEKTTLGLESALSNHLDTFYTTTVEIPSAEVALAAREATDLMDYIMPRLKKLGRKDGFKINKSICMGSAFDNTGVMAVTDMDVLIEIDKDKTAYESKGEGYMYIPVRQYKPIEGAKPDAFRFGRSKDGRYLSSGVVAKNIYELVARSLKLHPTARMQPFRQAAGSAQITVALGRYRVHVIPAIYIQADDTYLVSRCYAYDENPASDCLWRISHINKESAMLRLMGNADRGVHCKAFRLLKGLVRAEPTLHGLPSYHVKTALLHAFDDTVDHVTRWQRDSAETCFQRLLHDLLAFYTTRNLPNFFLRKQNLLADMPVRLVSRLQGRLLFLSTNQNELLRVLKKRSGCVEHSQRKSHMLVSV